MIYYKKYPTVNEGVGTLFDTPEPIKQMLTNMLGQTDFDDKHLFISEMDTEQFREYYNAVVQKCDEINELFFHEDGVNTAVVFPKLMYLFHNLESCYLLKNYFDKAATPEELAQRELAYQSTDHIIMTLDISAPLL
ncbi:MAG: hypothetical protein IJ274_01115 [Lachnospiraceae bacterium]|nr:hypothetical protein [Lachnospiraceae bacterium]MBQ9143187.1 hypothetical protein [Lachnospiraceae bacterium]